MSTQVQPENPQEQQNLEGQQTQQELGQQATEQQPANQQQPQERVYTTEEMRTIHELYGQTLRENEQRLNELQNRLNQQQQQPQSQPQEDDFLSNGRNIVAEEIDKRLQPFSQFIQQQQTQSLYSTLKEQFKKHPNFKIFFDIPNAENTLDQQVLQMPPNSVNVQSVASLISQIYGYMQLNGLVPQQQIQQPVINQQQQYTQTTQQSTMPNNPINPPHLRPSAPPMPTNGGQNLTPKGNVRRQLTELERRVARENRMSDDDYIDFLNEDVTRVATSDIGRPAGNR